MDLYANKNTIEITPWSPTSLSSHFGLAASSVLLQPMHSLRTSFSIQFNWTWMKQIEIKNGVYILKCFQMKCYWNQPLVY